MVVDFNNQQEEQTNASESPAVTYNLLSVACIYIIGTGVQIMWRLTARSSLARAGRYESYGEIPF